MFRHDYTKDFESLVAQKEPFAFVRFHDGEHAILRGLPYHAASKWVSRGNDVWFEEELRAALEAELPRYFLGISPPCCTPQATEYFRRYARGDHVTFATLFQFRNYRRMRELRAKFRNAVVIGSGRADIQVPPNGVSKEWDLQGVVDQMLEIDRPFLVAAGPCANVIIYRYWRLQDPEKRQTAIDVGAAIDIEVHKKQTRGYHQPGSKMQQHVCEWDKWKPFAPLRTEEADERTQAQNTYAKLADQPVIVGGKRTTKKGRYKEPPLPIFARPKK